MKNIQKTIARVVAGVIAIAVFGVAVLLLVPGLAPVSRSYAPLGLFLLCAALLTGTNLALPDRDNKTVTGILAIIVIVLSLATALIAFALAGEALFEHPGDFWALLFAVLATGLFLAIPWEKTDRAEDDGLKPHSGQNRPLREIGRAVLRALFGTALVGVTFLLFGIGFHVFVSLHAILFAQPPGGVFAALSGIVDILPDLAPILVLLPAVLIVVDVVRILLGWLFIAGYREANRDLTVEEITYVERSAETVEDYASRCGYADADAPGALVNWLVYGGLAVLLFWAWQVNFQPYKPPTPPHTGLYLMIPLDIGPSSVLLLFVVILSWSAPEFLLSCVWRDYAETMAWRNLTKKRLETSLKDHLVRFLRIGRLDPRAPIDPGRFLRRGGLALTRPWFFAFILLSAITAFFWVHDQAKTDIISDRGFEVVNYWTFEKARFPFAAVRSVELKCTWDNDKPDFAYTIHLPQGYDVEMVRWLKQDGSFAEYAAVDEALRRRNTPFRFYVRKPVWADPVTDYDPGCVRTLAVLYPGIERLFHLEAWR